MDLRSYFDDLNATEAKLRAKSGSLNGEVFVTSLFHRERNSTPGNVISATYRNAARVITDGTHRESTKEEIESFKAHQQEELEKSTVAEQLKKKQYIVVVDQKESAESSVFRAKSTKAEPVGSSK
jgi:hypothetical protein